MEAYALADTGRVRSMNQDYIYASQETIGSLPNLFLVADGMGGHQAGDFASRYAVEHLVVYLNRCQKGAAVAQLQEGIRQVTKHHSYVEEMVARGKMIRGSADYNRRKNIITRAMGIGTHVEADFFEADLESGDYILLCSDGLTNMVADERICAIISEPGTLKEKAERLIEEANESGGIDNIAVVLVKFEEGGTGLC